MKFPGKRSIVPRFFVLFLDRVCFFSVSAAEKKTTKKQLCRVRSNFFLQLTSPFVFSLIKKLET